MWKLLNCCKPHLKSKILRQYMEHNDNDKTNKTFSVSAPFFYFQNLVCYCIFFFLLLCCKKTNTKKDTHQHLEKYCSLCSQPSLVCNKLSDLIHFAHDYYLVVTGPDVVLLSFHICSLFVHIGNEQNEICLVVWVYVYNLLYM